MTYNPFNWYWLADDARVYASARQLVVADTDPDYVTWAEANTASQWPRDDAGNQTNDALQAVIAPYGLFVDLYYYAASVHSTTASGGIVLNDIPLASDRVTQSAVDAAYSYAQNNVDATYTGKLADGSFVVMDKAQLTDYAMALTAFNQSCNVCESDICDGIDGGTITERAQVDAAFAAIPNTFATTGTLLVKKRRRA